MGLFKKRRSLFVVNADKQLRSSLPGDPGLNVDDRAAADDLFVGPTVKLAVSPQPIL
jgi:hypothetical protein